MVIGVELITHYMDWSDRNVAVLFGDGAAAVVLQASEQESGVIGSVIGCDAEARPSLRVRGIGCGYAGRGITLGDTLWDFDGQVIFKRAVKAMSDVVRARDAAVRRRRGRRSTSWFRTRRICASSSRSQSTRASRWNA